jgi:hypothetical protein
VQWLDLTALGEAGLELPLAAANAAYFGSYIRRTSLASRRIGALALSLVNAALGVEAALFLLVSFAERSIAPGVGPEVAFFVRSLLLLAAAFLSLIVLRGSRPRSA